MFTPLAVAKTLFLKSVSPQILVTTWEGDRKNNTIPEKRAKFRDRKCRNFEIFFPCTMGDSEKAALAEKQLGNDAYKKKDFDTAIAHYSKVGGIST